MAKKEKKSKAEEPEADKPAAEGEEGAAPAKKKLSGKTLVLFIILPAILVLGGGGAAAMMLLGGKPAEAEGTKIAGKEGEKKPPAKKKEEKKDEKKKEGHGAEGESKEGAADAPADGIKLGTLTVGEDGAPSYYTMPKMIVNLSGAGEGERQLLLELELVLESSDPASFDTLPANMPRVIDQFQSFLRELRVEDLNGSAGSYRLRLELLKRFNTVMAPAKIDAVLVEGILVQ
jgi:flagellar FliL protein